MKTLILLIILLPLVTSAQNKNNDDVYGSTTNEANTFRVDTIPFQGVKKIIVQTGVSAKEGFTLAANTLMDNGFDIDKNDPSLFIIKTQNKLYKAKGATVHYYLNVRAKDNEVIISGKWVQDTTLTIGGISSTAQDYDIEKKKKSAFFVDMFTPLDDFAKKFKMPISYSR